MSILRVMLVVAILTSVASSQTPQLNNPPDLTIVRSGWSSSVRVSASDHSIFDSSEPPLGTMPSLVRPGPSSDQPLLTKRPPTSGFQYKLTVRNNGNRAITGITWDYVFLNSKGVEIGRHHFENTKGLNIRSGKSKQISNFSISHPAMVVSADDLRKDSKLSGKVEILKVDYEDGSSWQRSHQ
jgi:hypothetical protein